MGAHVDLCSRRRGPATCCRRALLGRGHGRSCAATVVERVEPVPPDGEAGDLVVGADVCARGSETVDRPTWWLAEQKTVGRVVAAAIAGPDQASEDRQQRQRCCGPTRRSSQSAAWCDLRAGVAGPHRQRCADPPREPGDPGRGGPSRSRSHEAHHPRRRGVPRPAGLRRAAERAAGSVSTRSCLHDIDAARLERIGRRARRARRRARRDSSRSASPPISSTAVEDADFVFCAIRVGGLEGRVVDEDVPLRWACLDRRRPARAASASRCAPCRSWCGSPRPIAEHAPRAPG